MRLTPPARSASLLAAMALFMVACGGVSTSALHSERGVQAIEQVVAPQIGLGSLVATCDAGDGLGFGDQFACEATTITGDTILFVATVTDGGAVEVVSLNVLTDAVIGSIEIAAIDVIRATEGLEISPDAIQCGQGPLVLPAGEILLLNCGLLNPTTGRVHSAVVRLTDIVDLRMTVEVSEDPV